MVICLQRGADLHTAQRMPLPLTVSCFSKIQISFTFLILAHPGSPGKRAVKRVCVCVCWEREEHLDNELYPATASYQYMLTVKSMTTDRMSRNTTETCTVMVPSTAVNYLTTRKKRPWNNALLTSSIQYKTVNRRLSSQIRQSAFSALTGTVSGL